MDPTQNNSGLDISPQVVVDLWRALLAAIVSLIAWVAKRTVNRMSMVIDKLDELETRLDRIEERSVTEFNRNAQMHIEMQHAIKELRESVLNLLYKGMKEK